MPILIFCLFACQEKKSYLDFILLWKQKEFSPYFTVAHLGIEGQVEQTQAKAGEISCLKAKQGEQISFELVLGKDPFFLFYPLTKINENQSILYEVSVSVKNKFRKTYKFNLKYNIPPAPQRVLVDLKEHQNKKIRLTLSGFVYGEEEKEILWGSPLIIHKIKNGPKKNKNLNFLLISIDTLRADALGVYGKNPSITPNIDSFAKEADLWQNCYSTSNKTNPSFCSILSGLYSKHHGIYNLVDPLPQNITTLSEIFKEKGYETMAVVSAFHLHSGANLCSRFSRYRVSEETFSTEEAVFETINYLKNSEKPFFLWLHIFDPHTPHTAPEPFFSGYYAGEKFEYFPFNNFKKQRNIGHLDYIDPNLLANPRMYYDEVAYLDFSLGFLFNFLKNNGFYENTVIAFISDHGENLDEHGCLADHHGLWETTTHIPLMLKIPEKKDFKIYKHFVQSIDLFQTILRLFNFDNYKNDGIDLYPEYHKNNRNFVFSEALEDWEVMARNDKYCFKVYRKENSIEVALYDLLKDPKEKFNVSDKKNDISERFLEITNLFLKDKTFIKGKQNISEEDIKKLKSLGYLY